MILLLAGTADGKEIALRLSRAGHQFIACTATAYGSRLLTEVIDAEVLAGRLDSQAMADLLRQRGISLVIDATHPYAEEVTANARQACAATGVPYIRFQRPALPLPDHRLIHPVEGYQAAAAKAAELAEKNIFLATGLKTLPLFAAAAQAAGKKVIARITPDPEGVRRCLELGIGPGNIVAMQGPFSAQLNQQLFIHYRADLLVTKESGAAGGTDAKLEAALALDLPVILITRPPAPAGACEDIEELLANIPWNERTSKT
ncbi:MAG: precorrin-6A reductase [Firmicutes bacterium]|nr:precorrin-6A reductase [Bacillota bacterium]